MTVKEAEAVFGKRAKNEHELRRITSERELHLVFRNSKQKWEQQTDDRGARRTGHVAISLAEGATWEGRCGGWL